MKTPEFADSEMIGSLHSATPPGLSLTLWWVDGTIEVRAYRNHLYEKFPVTLVIDGHRVYQGPEPVAETGAEPGAWRQAEGALKGVGRDEPAEVTVRRIRGGT